MLKTIEETGNEVLSVEEKKAIRKEYSRMYYLENKEKMKTKSRSNYWKNVVYSSEKHREYFIKNAEKIAQKQREKKRLVVEFYMESGMDTIRQLTNDFRNRGKEGEQCA